MMKVRILDRREFCDGLTKKLPDISIAEFLVGVNPGHLAPHAVKLAWGARSSCVHMLALQEEKNNIIRILVQVHHEKRLPSYFGAAS